MAETAAVRMPRESYLRCDAHLRELQNDHGRPVLFADSAQSREIQREHDSVMRQTSPPDFDDELSISGQDFQQSRETNYVHH